MQVIASTNVKAGRPSRLGVVSALGIGLVLVAASAALLYLVFGQDLLSRFMPRSRPSTYELVVGALAWTFALTAPAGFGLVGVARLVTAFGGRLAVPGSRPPSGSAARSATTTWSPRRCDCPTGTGSCRSS
jgi:hypothetical protein